MRLASFVATVVALNCLEAPEEKSRLSWTDGSPCSMTRDLAGSYVQQQ